MQISGIGNRPARRPVALEVEFGDALWPFLPF